jgi:hypothetical protein
MSKSRGPRWIGTKDNAGALWVKQHTNFIKTLTLEGMDEKQLITELFLNCGLMPNKSKDIIFHLSEMGLVFHVGNVIKWNEAEHLSEDEKQGLRRKVEEKTRERSP